ncbi:hypothetical protein Tcan_05511 [Toxocara canis]|uniref:N-acetyltransferase domain-containing protein n=1 Tax=Toxocara canis TaxID=6265 RepID=A0A0B2VT41_TOXCA|nr:hypothetical protein Tcan_05511 [Toxocara canis]
MSKYEIIRNPDDDVWRKIVDLTYKDESWTLGYQDYGIWLEAFSTNGFILFAAITTDTQEVVGSVSLAAYGSNVEHPEVMTVGMFYVRPDHRGMGIGSRLFSELMDEANKRGGNVALNGVLPMSPKYASRYAFNKFNEWHPMPVTIAVEHLRPSMLPKDAELELVSINDVVLNQLYDYDLSIVGIMRRAYLNALFRHKQSTHKIAMKSGRITGFINARNVVGNYLSIGPFYADNNVRKCVKNFLQFSQSAFNKTVSVQTAI